MTQRIAFLDVDTDDAVLVQKRFPDAVCLPADLTGDALMDALKEMTIVSTFITTSFPRTVTEKLPMLKLLCTRSVGYDHIDLEACREHNVTVCNVPDYGSHVIAEHVFALLLSTLRHVLEGQKRVQSGTFDYHGLRGIALKDKTIGIVGTGKIGCKVAQIAHGFDMKILAVDQCRTIDIIDRFGVQYVTFEELLAQSDIITLHLPETTETHHIVNASAFGRMKDGMILVNTARGTLIDSAALLESLKSKKVRYALLDVLEHEHNFEENKELVRHEGVVATPHIAFYADDSMRNMFLDSFESIDSWVKGDTPHHVIHPPQVVCDLPALKAS